MNKNIITIAVIIVVGAGSFYAGSKYDQSKSLAAAGQGAAGGQGGFQRGAGLAGGGRRAGMGANGGFSGGDIIAKDATSITVKLRDNDSKIIFLSDSTQIMKAVAGSLKDLSVGQSITVTGNPNADGSISAQTIHIRPASTTQSSVK